MVNYGYKQSVLDGTEMHFEAIPELQVPSEYSYKNMLPKALDQGRKPICVPCSIYAYINNKRNMFNGSVEKNNVDLDAIYNARTNEDGEGMTFKDALHFLRHNGVKTSFDDNFKINHYYMVGSIMQLKHALLVNGVCIGGLPVYDTTIDEFWANVNDYQGGHAIAIVGYNEEGFIIRNSWGVGYGYDGYYILKYEDFSKFTEIWTID